MNVTFIIPCYNAEKIINNNHKKLSSFLKKNKIKKKIIYINDGSEDKTSKLAEEFARRRVNRHWNQRRESRKTGEERRQR